MTLYKALQSKKIYWVMIYIGLILVVLPMVSAWNSTTLINSTCYQETANVSSSCGGLSTGNYVWDDYASWTDPLASIDGDWNTYGAYGIAGNGYLRINYTKPTGSTGATLRLKDINGAIPTTEEIPLPSSCWNANDNRISIVVRSLVATTIWYCVGITGGLSSLRTSDGIRVYEEAIIWTMPNPTLNYTYDNLTYTTHYTKSVNNLTRYLIVPENTVLTKAYLNISGYSYGSTVHVNTTTYICDVDVGTYGDNTCNEGLVDSSSITYVHCEGTDMCNYTVNYTLYDTPINNATIQFFWTPLISTIDSINGTIYIKNYSSGNWIYVANQTNVNALVNSLYGFSKSYDVAPLMNNGRVTLYFINTRTDSAGGDAMRINLATLYVSDTNPRNISLFVGNNQGYSNANIFNGSNIRTINLANITNTYLYGCTYYNGYCAVPYRFHTDTSGILQYFSMLFDNLGFLENSQTFNSNVYETSSQSFQLNLTYDSSYYNGIIANLIYNGTSYSATKTGTGNNLIFSRTADIPLINGIIDSKTFYWEVQLTNSSGINYFNSTIKTQTIEVINMSKCGGLTIKALNFTAYDQKNLSRLYTFDFKSTLNYFIGSEDLYRNMSINDLNVNETAICIRNDTNYKISGIIEYSKTGWQVGNYYFSSHTINSTTQNISLYLLDSSLSTSFIIKVQDSNQLPLQDYYVEIYRYYPELNELKLVQLLRTDEDGKSVGFFETETVDYKFIIKNSTGSTVYISGLRKIIPETAPYTITFTIDEDLGSPYDFYYNLTDLVYSLSYSNLTDIVTLIYTDSATNFTSANLIVSKLSYNGTNPIICNITSTSASNTLTCDLTGNSTGGYVANFYLKRDSSTFLIKQLIFEIEELSEIFGMLGVFAGFLIILICGCAFAYNEVAGIILVNMGVIFVDVIGLINFGGVFITAMIGVSILALIVLVKS